MRQLKDMTRINIEIDNEIHKKAKVAAAIEGITLIEFINKSLSDKIGKERLR